MILRLPHFDKTLTIESTGFVITQTQTWRYDGEHNTFEMLSERFETMHRLLDRDVDTLLVEFDAFRSRVVELEATLYAPKEGGKFMHRWLALKHDLLRIEQLLLRAGETVERLILHYRNDATFPYSRYSDLHEHLVRIERSASLQLSKLDSLYHFHNARTTEKMNRMIYLLTILSAIIMPLNLIVGFFGMNTTALPFAQTPQGTLYASGLLLSTLVLSIALLLWVRQRYM
ncbi:MAG: magnesium transporter [Campylobacterales bacterium]|nr:magnesium transporter [Campylobacterales bacterium]